MNVSSTWIVVLINYYVQWKMSHFYYKLCDKVVWWFEGAAQELEKGKETKREKIVMTNLMLEYR